MLKLKRPWSDGTVALVFEPEVFVERLAALVPAPQKNQVHYHGVFAPAHRWRSLIVPDGVRRKKKMQARKQSGKPPGFDERWVPWEELIHRVFGRDVISCPACGCRIWLVDQIVDPFSAQLELAVMGLAAQLVAFRPARGPPERLLP